MLAAERAGYASVDRLIRKYQHLKIAKSWLELADIFLGIPMPEGGSEPDPQDVFRKVLMFKKPE